MNGPNEATSRWPDDQATEQMLADAARLAAQVLRRARQGPVTREVPAEFLHEFRSGPAPEEGRSWSQVLGDVAEKIAPFPMGNGSPRFMAWVNSPPHPVGVAASAIAAAMNPSVAGGFHAAVHVERQVAGWFLDLIGWPRGEGVTPSAFGLAVSGGSAATTTALTAARRRAYAAIGWDVRADGLVGAPQPVVFATAAAHSCAVKAVEQLGIGSRHIRWITTDSRDRMDPVDLARKVGGAAAEGLLPIAVVASVGTVNTGAIDPIADIAAVCGEHGVWLHVDGAYGAPPVLLLAEFAETRAALRSVDSLALDPHKWLYTPVDAGLVLLRDGDTGRAAFSLVPDYLSVEHADDEPRWFSEYTAEQTRPFRALKLWMQLQYIGFDGYRAMISRALEASRELSVLIEESADFELISHGLSVVCFRHRPDGLAESGLDEHNRTIANRSQRGGRAFLAPTVVQGKAALRACILEPRTTHEDLRAVLDALREAQPT